MRLYRSILSLALATMGFASMQTPAQATVTASASLRNFSISLLDLDNTDLINPSVSFSSYTSAFPLSISITQPWDSAADVHNFSVVGGTGDRGAIEAATVHYEAYDKLNLSSSLLISGTASGTGAALSSFLATANMGPDFAFRFTIPRRTQITFYADVVLTATSTDPNGGFYQEIHDPVTGDLITYDWLDEQANASAFLEAGSGSLGSDRATVTAGYLNGNTTASVTRKLKATFISGTQTSSGVLRAGISLSGQSPFEAAAAVPEPESLTLLLTSLALLGGHTLLRSKQIGA